MNQIEIYKAPDSKIEINVNLENETVWLSQGQMAILFEKGRAIISEHIQNVSKEGELDEKVVCRDFRQTEINRFHFGTC